MSKKNEKSKTFKKSRKNEKKRDLMAFYSKNKNPLTVFDFL